MEKRRVVITGLGTVNPLGNNVSASWDAAMAGKCGIGPITQFDASEFKCKLAGEVKNFDPETVVDKKEARKMARFTLLALAAATEAIADSGLDTEAEARQIGVILSSGIGGLPTIEEQHTRGEEKGMEKVSPYFVPMAIANMAAAQVAIRFGLKGMCTCPVTACAGGTNAVGDAFHRIRDGYEPVMVCGGAESCISPLGIGGEAGVKALTYYFENLINDVESGVRKPAAVILEAVQGEGGVNNLGPTFVSAIAKLAKEKDILIAVDEVQTGNGRTGTYFAYQQYGITPDIVTTAKGLGGGLPIGAVLFGEKLQDTMTPGSHLWRHPGGGCRCLLHCGANRRRLPEGSTAQEREDLHGAGKSERRQEHQWYGADAGNRNGQTRRRSGQGLPGKRPADLNGKNKASSAAGAEHQRCGAGRGTGDTERSA